MAHTVLWMGAQNLDMWWLILYCGWGLKTLRCGGSYCIVDGGSKLGDVVAHIVQLFMVVNAREFDCSYFGWGLNAWRSGGSYCEWWFIQCLGV